MLTLDTPIDLKYPVSYQSNCSTAEILDNTIVNAPNISSFLWFLREKRDVLAKIRIPSVEDNKEHGELPTIIYSGVYDTRSAVGLGKWNGVIALDLDALKDLKNRYDSLYFEEQLEKVIDCLSSVKWIEGGNIPVQLLGYNSSKSGKGLRLLYAVDPDIHVYSDVARYYRDVYLSLGAVIESFLVRNDITCFEVDESAADISHPFAVVKGRYAFYEGKKLPDGLVIHLLHGYEKQKRKYRKSINRIVDVQATIKEISKESFALKPGVTLDEYRTRFQVAQVLSYMYGADGYDLYANLLLQAKREKYVKGEFKAYWKKALADAQLNTVEYAEKMSRTIGYYLPDVKFSYRYMPEIAADDYIVNHPAQEPFMTGLQGVWHINQYLKERQHGIVRALKLYKRIVLQADTGTGKTSLMKELVKYFPDSKIDFIAPTLSIVQQQDIEQVTGNKPLSEVQFKAPILATTYASIKKLSVRNAAVLVIDEAHHLVEDFTEDFRANNIKDIIHSWSQYTHVVLCTGTAHNLSFQGFKHIRIEKYRIDTLTLTEGVELSRFMLEEGDLKAIYVTNKQTGMELVNRATKTLGYRAEEVVFLNADAKKHPAYQTIVTQQMLPASTRLLITTKLLADGVNINNTYAKVNVFYYPSRTDALTFNEIKQFSARFRKADAVKLHIGEYGERPTKSHFLPNYEGLQKLVDAQNGLVRESRWIVSNVLDPDNDSYNIKRMGNSYTDYTLYNPMTNLYEVNEVQCQRQHQLLLNTLFRNSAEVRAMVLKELGIVRISSGTRAGYVTEQAINASVKERSKLTRESERKEFGNLLKFDGLVTDRFQKHMLAQYNEMVSNGFAPVIAQNIMTNCSGVEIADRVMTSRYLHNYKVLAKGLKPRAGEKLTVNDCALISFYIKVDKYIRSNNIQTFDPSDPDFISALNSLATKEKQRFCASIPTTLTSRLVVETIKVMYDIKRSKCWRNKKTSNFYQINRRLTLEEFQSKPMEKPASSLFEEQL